MILFGFKDLQRSQLIKLLLSSKIQLEKKIQQDFKFEIKEEEPQEYQHKKIVQPLQQLYVRSTAISIGIFILQNKQCFQFENLEELSNRFNEQQIDQYSDFSNYFSKIEQKQLNLLNNSQKQIFQNSDLLIIYFYSNLLNKLTIIEGSLYLESKNLGYKFLDEIEKGNYSNRKIAKCIQLYKNYYKSKTSSKKKPKFPFTNEIYTSYNLLDLMRQFTSLILSQFSFTKKPFLNEKQIKDSFYLSNFVDFSISNIQDNLQQLLKQVIDLKNQKSEFQYQLQGDNLQDTFNIFWQMQFQVYNQVHQETFKKNKGKSESWNQLAEFYQGAKIEKLEIFINEYQPKIDQIYELLNNILLPDTTTNKKPKIPKGTKDTTPLQMAIKQKAIEMIKDVYKQHGAVEIDTPVFELKETLLGKYGEEGGKLIYDLEDQGGELLSLRYDLTVPFARFMGLNNIQKLKRFHIGKVYRRDQPNMNKGRFREFYQCDFDIAGKSDDLLADSEVLLIMTKILKKFDLDFKIKISHRFLLEAIIECSDCDLKKFKTICSSIDKLDKEPWEKVENELIFEKGLKKEQTEKLQKFVLNNGSIEDLLKKFEVSKLFGESEKAKKSLLDMKKLAENLKILGCYDSIVFDLSLARGLDYYTGVIYEAVLIGESGLGSIGGGGRYDGLIGMFSKKPIPSVGMSIGIERLFIILEQKMKDSTRQKEADIFVASFGKGLSQERLKLLNLLWGSGLKAEMTYERDPRPDKQLKFALENKYPLMLQIGEDEIKENKVKIKILETKETIEVNREDLVDKLKSLIQI